MKDKRPLRLKIEKIRSADMDKSIELDWTFSVNPRTKGTYSRRLGDIRLATGKFATAKLPSDSPARFLGYYFGCEKLAKAVLGIARLWPAAKAFDHKTPLDMEQLKTAVKKLGIAFADPDLIKIFGTQPAPAKPTFGREIRNRLIHDFGPSNVDHAKAAAKVLTPVMMKFLACEHQAQEYIVKLNIHHPVAQKRVGQWLISSITSDRRTHRVSRLIAFGRGSPLLNHRMQDRQPANINKRASEEHLN